MEQLLGARPLLDEQLNTVAHVERRRLLCALAGEDPQEEPPIKIAAVEGVAETRESQVTMQHNHLPRLEAHGFIQWDKEHHQVTRGPKFDEIEPLLELILEHRNELSADWV